MHIKIFGVFNDDLVVQSVSAHRVRCVGHVDAPVLKSLDLETVAGERADLRGGNFDIRIRFEVPARDFDRVVGKRGARIRDVPFPDLVLRSKEHDLHAEVAARNADPVAAHVARPFGGDKDELFARRRIEGFERKVSALDDDGVAVGFLCGFVRGMEESFGF